MNSEPLRIILSNIRFFVTLESSNCNNQLKSPAKLDSKIGTRGICNY